VRVTNPTWPRSRNKLQTKLARCVPDPSATISETDRQIAELHHQIEIVNLQLVEATTAHERDREELQLYQDRARENELGEIKRNQSTLSLGGTLEAELADGEIKGESKTE